MLLLALAGGLRVSELVGLRIDEVEFTGRYVEVRVRSKGHRERALTLWKSVGDALRAWLTVRGDARPIRADAGGGTRRPMPEACTARSITPNRTGLVRRRSVAPFMNHPLPFSQRRTTVHP